MPALRVARNVTGCTVLCKRNFPIKNPCQGLQEFVLTEPLFFKDLIVEWQPIRRQCFEWRVFSLVGTELKMAAPYCTCLQVNCGLGSQGFSLVRTKRKFWKLGGFNQTPPFLVVQIVLATNMTQSAGLASLNHNTGSMSFYGNAACTAVEWRALLCPSRCY